MSAHQDNRSLSDTDSDESVYPFCDQSYRSEGSKLLPAQRLFRPSYDCVDGIRKLEHEWDCPTAVYDGYSYKAWAPDWKTLIPIPLLRDRDQYYIAEDLKKKISESGD